MSEGSISQEEIDALLSGVDMGGLTSGGTSSIVPDASIDTVVLKDSFHSQSSLGLQFSLRTLHFHFSFEIMLL